jgi:hypothetical protein
MHITDDFDEVELTRQLVRWLEGLQDAASRGEAAAHAALRTSFYGGPIGGPGQAAAFLRQFVIPPLERHQK